MHETKIEQVNHDEPLESHDQQASTPDTIVERPPHPRSAPSSYSVASTDDEELPDPLLLEEGIPSTVPLEALAGPALILPTTTDIDGRTLHEEFDWDAKDEDEDLDKKEDDDNDSKKKKRGALEKSSVIICFNENSSYIAWSCIVLFALIFIAIDIAIFVAYNKREQITMTSYGLQLWFTWIAFMWCIGFMSQILVELIPWAIKKSMGYLRPQSTEVLRMRLSYYMALRIYIKLILISAWAWGSWAFIQDHVQLPLISSSPDAGDQYASKPQYTSVFYSIWECCFFATLFLFVEKFILQLIVTSFHKKAYGDRIKENDKALRILDRLKKMKRKNPQEFLLKRIRRKPKTNSGTNTTVPSRSHSMDENIPQQGKSIMTGNQQYNDGKSNVKFPSQNMDTLIAIPPLEDRVNKSDDEKQDFQQIQEPAPSHEENKRKSFFNKLPKIKRTNTHSAEAFVDAPPPLVRDNTWFSRNSQDEKGFFSATRDFGLSTTAIPVKLFKGGYNKFVSQKNYGKQTGQPSQQAKYLAKKIYSNVLGPDSNRDKVIESDFYPFFRTTKEAAYAFSLFDADGNGDITKRELRSGCVRIYRERKNLTRSMRDLSQATGKLDIILMIVFVVIWVIIVCAAFGVNVGTDLMPLWSAFVAASFVFGTSAKDAFEAIIFVFVTHPFDAGDRVLIQGENWVVQNVGLLVTTFLKWDGSVVYAKNSVLTSQYIINVRRSGRTGETVELQISFSTPSWKIRKITEHMQKWCNEYPKLYTPNSASTNVTGFQNQNKITLSFYFEHTQNWQDPGGRWLRHNNFMWELKEECERLEINYTLPPQPFVAESKPNDAPPEAYNMGSKSGYGLEGMQQRRPFQDNDDEIKNVPIGAESGGHAGNSASDNSGAAAGAASTLMFAADM